MDRLTTLELFTRIVDRGSFSAAAIDVGVSRPVATAAIQALEERLGARLLQRTTRHVSPTIEGEAYYRRGVQILADLEEADGACGAVRGLLRVDVAGNLARTIILPELSHFLARHPALTVQLGESERFVDLVREGVDCVVRAGELADSDMVVRRLGLMEEITCASPAYLAQHGVPVSLDALDGHVMVGFVSSRTGQVMPLEFMRDGVAIMRTLPARVLVSGADASAAAARLGLGLVQAPRHRFLNDLAAGTLAEVLAEYPPAPTLISLLYPTRRQLSPRVRVFVEWLEDVIRPYLRSA
ncbi:LysR family transcriptional regulator [Rhodopila sp.]|uniref:LysR family transcriptional regulator n=1 Tax=Rhodopila sp. TaxID=2480087 RepID=UPI003D0E8B5B